MIEESGAKTVDEDGIVYLHAHEVVLPAAKSEAHAKLVAEDSRTSVHYYFPVEIEVVAGCDGADPHAIADLALDKLARSVRAGAG